MQSQLEGSSDGGAGRLHPPRAIDRRAVLRRAKILFDDCVIDCLVLNLSPSGARVRTDVMIEAPDRLGLRFSDGATYPCLKRWASGQELGFQFVGGPTLPDAVATEAIRLRAMLDLISLDGPLKSLRGSGFFGDIALQETAERAATALQDLKSALARLTRRE